MQILKYILLFFILLASTLIGKFIAKKYIYRLKELEEIKNALNTFKSKIKFTYEPIPVIFEEIALNSSENIGQVFKKSSEYMKNESASIAWEHALDEVNTYLKKDDKNVLKNLSKLLGQTDVEGQEGQIELTQNFLDTQIKEAEEEKQKNVKLYSRLGTIIGLVIIIILC